MCPIMSFIGSTLFGVTSITNIITKWLQTCVLNFPMALCFQIFYAGPLVRLIFRCIFKKQLKENVKIIKPQEKHYLNIKAYEILNYSMDDLNKMDSNELDRVNHQVYDYFKIRENAINKEYLLEKALEAIERENNKVTSGNGYVDILLIMGIICTIIMVVGIFTFIII